MVKRNPVPHLPPERPEAGDAERGASLVEYGLLLALIAVVCVLAVTSLGTGLDSSYDGTTSSLFGG